MVPVCLLMPVPVLVRWYPVRATLARGGESMSNWNHTTDLAFGPDLAYERALLSVSS